MKKDDFGRTDLDNTLNEVTSHPERGLGLIGVKGIIVLIVIVIVAVIIYVVTK
ncbi:hypothetical protein KII93_05770 [Leuconostoc gelidum subsp. gasicomitatum]|uniref:hypothetical protein n=1 Tax=Leuconostoc gasicomitatum TaxID=115778 RepID=UPI0007E22E1D|nr:hypothetical protein [Leuconostoc gasicomitatum]MBZ5947970.1 hypothetical protein [Leuconostoc gasicomitatum]CUW11020.1 hypothetical protein PB1E_1761 [Leuconostoc gasicomitatum]